MADTSSRNLSGDVSDKIDEGILIENKDESNNFGEQCTEELSFSNLSIEYEALRPMVADIIQKELRVILGECITSDIRDLVCRKI